MLATAAVAAVVVVTGVGAAWASTWDRGGARHADRGLGPVQADLVLVGTFVSGRSVDVPGRSRLGNYDLFKESLFEVGGVDPVGSDRGICWVHAGGIECEITFRLTGRGDLQAAGFIGNNDALGLMSITGGTGEFAGARGQLQIEFGDDALEFTFDFVP
jgi:hypothetical protein